MKVAKEINKYQEKIFFGMNSRQLLSLFLSMILVVIPTVLINYYFDFLLAVAIGSTLALGVGVFSMFYYNGMYIEDILKNIFPILLRTKIPVTKLNLYQQIEDDLLITNKSYLKIYQLSDINYLTVKMAERKLLFDNFCSFLNLFAEDIEVNQFLVREKIDQKFIENIKSTLKDDQYDSLREEVNNQIEKILDEKSYISKKYFVLIISGLNKEQAIKRLDDLKMAFDKYLQDLNNNNNIFVTLSSLRKKELENLILKDLLNLSSIENTAIISRANCCEIIGEDTVYQQSFALAKLPNYLPDEVLKELMELNIKMKINLKIKIFGVADRIKYLKKIRSAVEANKLEFLKKKLDSSQLPTQIKEQLEATSEIINLINEKSQNLYDIKLLITQESDNLRQLESNSVLIQAALKKYQVSLSRLDFQHLEGILETLPIGKENLIFLNKIVVTETLACFHPFKARSYPVQKKGAFYGQNQITADVIKFDRGKGKNDSPNGFILGTTGSGKSFAAKLEIIQVLINNDDDVVIIDPENEYAKLVSSLQGETIDVSTTSSNFINPLEINEIDNYQDAVKMKSEYLQTLLETMLGKNLTLKEQSLIDKAVHKIYADCFKFKGVPTLENLRTELAKFPEIEDLVVALEIYTTGSLAIFSNKSSVEIKNKLTCFKINKLSKQLKKVGLLVVMEMIWQKVIVNQKVNRRTRLYIDEIYLLFDHQMSINYLISFYKRFRKYGGIITGITQNVEDLLLNDSARKMLANSEFLLLLGQKSTDLRQLVKLFELSDVDKSYISQIKHGQGLVIWENQVMPFRNVFTPTNKIFEVATSSLNNDL